MSIWTSSASLYTVRGDGNRTRRLHAQANSVREHTAALLEPVTLPPDATAIDLGCGPGRALDLLSELAGPSGHLVGVDIDAHSVSSARAFAKERGLANVEVVRADARRTGLADSSYDLVHARFLLANVLAPEQIIAEMARLLRPGGWMAVMEADAGLRVDHPSHCGAERLTELLGAAPENDGADPYVGRRLPHLLAAAGLVGIGAQARAGTPLLPVTYLLAWARKPVRAA